MKQWKIWAVVINKVTGKTGKKASGVIICTSCAKICTVPADSPVARGKAVFVCPDCVRGKGLQQLQQGVK